MSHADAPLAWVESPLQMIGAAERAAAHGTRVELAARLAPLALDAIRLRAVHGGAGVFTTFDLGDGRERRLRDLGADIERHAFEWLRASATSRAVGIEIAEDRVILGSARVVVKLRGGPGEHETHREHDGYVELLAGIGPLPPNLVVPYEPMRHALDRAEGLVTVSSTAAIEAAVHGVPVIALDTFGVDDALINTVFRGSGLLAGADDFIARRLRHPDVGWLDDNYFHDDADGTWMTMMRDLVLRRAAGDLAPRDVSDPVGGALRDAWHRRIAIGSRDRTLSGAVAVAIGMPARFVMRVLRALVSARA